MVKRSFERLDIHSKKNALRETETGTLDESNVCLDIPLESSSDMEKGFFIDSNRPGRGNPVISTDFPDWLAPLPLAGKASSLSGTCGFNQILLANSQRVEPL